MRGKTSHNPIARKNKCVFLNIYIFVVLTSQFVLFISYTVFHMDLRSTLFSGSTGTRSWHAKHSIAAEIKGLKGYKRRNDLGRGVEQTLTVSTMASKLLVFIKTA